MRGLTEGGFRLVAITPPDFRPGEAAEIAEALRRGWWRVHIRKPGHPDEAIERLINDIPEELRPRLTLHDLFHLAEKTGIGGIHLNFRNPEPPAGWRGMLSASCHSVNEARYHRGKVDYMFLSPVYDSLSKPGYGSRFTEEELALSGALGPDVLALGGVTPSKRDRLRRLGFGGAAMLTAAWQPLVEEDKTILQYITDRPDGLEEVLRGGCRWVQLRVKEASDEEFASLALPVGRLCRKDRATFILDDRAHLVEALKADGVHIGKNDIPLAEARAMLGPVKIIGATANTPAEAAEAARAGADYLGIGPFRFTTTKKRLAPILGAAGIAEAVAAARAARPGIPVVAIGGIGIPDLAEVNGTGATGVAVSGLILNSQDKTETTKEIIRIWKN